MTKEPQDRYLNSAKYIRELEIAEEKNQLDAQGVLDELGKAVAHCDKKSDEYIKKSDEYMLARAAYFAEAKRRIKSGFEFAEFLKSAGISRGHGYRLAKFGNSNDPQQALEEFRVKKEMRAREVKKAAAREPSSPYAEMARLWWKLSISERHKFLTWASQNLRRFDEAAD